jgi:uncharacterized peroxidase-related enzyme
LRRGLFSELGWHSHQMASSRGSTIPEERSVSGCRADFETALRRDEIERLLGEGFGADIGERWNAIVAASVALARTPSAFSSKHVRRLRDAGLDDLAIADVIQSAAFFNLANRLMLSLGEPDAA